MIRPRIVPYTVEWQGGLASLLLDTGKEWSGLAALLTADREPGPRSGKSDYDRAKDAALSSAARRIPLVGPHVQDLLRSTGVTPPSKGSDKRRAIAGWARETNKGEPEKAREWLDWYRDRQGQNISAAKLYEALDEYNK